MAAFAAFDRAALSAAPALGPPLVHVAGVERWTCPTCGSPLAARFSYLPDQVYVPLGIMDQAADLVPQVHCHTDSALPWLHIDDDTPREGGTARDVLNSATS